MLGMGWQEIFLVAVVAVIVVGPKELPRVLRTASYWFRKVRGMAREFQSGVEDVIRETELQEIRKELEETANTDISQNLIESVDPDGDFEGAVRGLEDTIAAPIEDEQIADEAIANAESGSVDGAPEDAEPKGLSAEGAEQKEADLDQQPNTQDVDLDAAPKSSGGVV